MDRKSTKRRFLHKIFVALSIALLLTGTVGVCAEGETDAASNDRSSSGQDWEISAEVLRLQIKYLSAEELIKEAERWQAILRTDRPAVEPGKHRCLVREPET